MNCYDKIINMAAEGRKMFAILVDPDVPDVGELAKISQAAVEPKVDFIFIGGSLLKADQLKICIDVIKQNANIPTIIFPGSHIQISDNADAILFISLISGRNPDLLIGQHVLAAPFLKQANLEIIPTGYMLVEGGAISTALYVSNTIPIPHHKPDIAACTAIAGEMLGMKLIYLDAGSGAPNPVSNEMISMVKKSINLPLIVGGGIVSAELAEEAYAAGADVLVVGTAIEQNYQRIFQFCEARNQFNKP